MFLKTKKEFEDFLLQDNIQQALLKNEKQIGERFPDMNKCIGFAQNNKNHHLDVYRHTALAMHYSPKILDVRMALFFHDIGKPVCYQDNDKGIRSFKGHPRFSAIITKNILENYGYEDIFIKKITNFVKYHDDFITNRDVQNKIAKIGYKNTGKLLKIQECDIKAHHPNKIDRRLGYLDCVKQTYSSTKYNTKKKGEKYDRFK